MDTYIEGAHSIYFLFSNLYNIYIMYNIYIYIQFNCTLIILFLYYIIFITYIFILCYISVIYITFYISYNSNDQVSLYYITHIKLQNNYE